MSTVGLNEEVIKKYIRNQQDSEMIGAAMTGDAKEERAGMLRFETRL